MVSTPHGGKLVNREVKKVNLDKNMLSLDLDMDSAMDLVNIGTGAFSPIEGFMCRDDYEDVLKNMRVNNAVWTLPITLDVDDFNCEEGDDILLKYNKETIGVLHLEEKFSYDKKKSSKLIYNSDSLEHPGVKYNFSLGKTFLGGKIDLIKIPEFRVKQYELIPSETREIFMKRKWKKIVAFHTRNAIHRSHEYLQRMALESVDGLFIQPVVGKKKEGDFSSEMIIKSYEIMMDKFYPKDRVFFSVLPTFSRYAGPREAVFTALVRKNFGATHFIIGRDHTGVGNFYKKYDSHKIFENFDDLGMEIFFYHGPFYCKKCEGFATEHSCPHDEKEHIDVSGTKIREILNKGELPPKEMMRVEIAKMIIEELNNGGKVFH